jgi:DNA-binding NtrC family response regulator
MLRKKILIVDDDVDYLIRTKNKIESMGFEAVLAESQKECEMIIETFKPDLALLDLMLESEDSGFVLSYKIKQKYPEVPVILATTVIAESGIAFDMDYGAEKSWIKADLILDKGMGHDQLEKEIRKFLKI